MLSKIKGLPVPADGDTGKVPTVQEDGSYAPAEAGGGFLTLTEHPDDREYILSATYDDIISASGACVTINGNRAYLVSTSTETRDNIVRYYVVFMRTDISGSTGTPSPLVYVTLSENDYPRRAG